ncbi:Plexin domain-containing 1, partial [Paramuricea clavata]
MGNILLGLFILSNVFAEGFCHEYQVHYEVNDFGELGKPRFQISHDIIKRSALAENVTSTASPPKSVKPTTHVITNPATSFDRTTGKPSAITNNQPSGKPTAHPTSRKTSHPPTNIPRTQTLRNNTTTRFQVLRTTPRPVNNTNGTNITIFQDNHKYFKSRYYPSGERWWFNLNDGSGTPKLHVGLTKNLQYSDTIKTSFRFPYYGHVINKVTITNKGFLFLGQKLHKFNASVQYVAPLMADFGAHLHDKTSIRYVDT